MVSLEVVAILLSGISISASLFYYSSVLQNANKTQKQQLKTRQAQLFMQFADKFSSKEGLEYLRVLGKATWVSHEEWLEMIQNDIEYDNAYRWLRARVVCDVHEPRL